MIIYINISYHSFRTAAACAVNRHITVARLLPDVVNHDLTATSSLTPACTVWHSDTDACDTLD